MAKFLLRRLVHSLCVHQKAGPQMCAVPRAFIKNYSSTANSISTVDTESLLDHLNNATLEELQSWKSFSESQINALLDQREQNHVFGKLDDVLTVKGLGLRTLQKFTSEFLQKDLEQLWPQQDTASRFRIKREVIHPKYAADQMPESVVACGVQLDSLYWARIDSDFTLTDWNYKTLGPYLRRHYDHALFQQQFWQLMQYIPKGDVYLLEDLPPGKHVTLHTVPGALMKARMETILTTLLNFRNNQDSSQALQQMVYKLKFKELGKYYNLMVGGEKVSCQKVAMDILKCRRMEQEFDVRLPKEQWDNFVDSKATVKEQMCVSLLQVVMFYELLVKQLSTADSELSYKEES